MSAIAAVLETAETSLPEKGELHSLPPLKLLVEAALSHWTGLLHVSLFDRDISVFFRHGTPAQTFSTHPEDATTTEVPAIRALLRRLLSQPEGAFLLEKVDLPRRNDVPLGDGVLLIPALIRENPSLIRQPSLPADWAPKLRANPKIKLGQLQLEPMEIHIATRFNGQKSLKQLQSERPAESELIARVALVLWVFELLSFEQQHPSVLLTPPPASVKPTSPIDATTATDVSRLLKAEELFRKSQGLFRVKNHQGALEKLNEAIECVPHESEFYAWHGYLTYLTTHSAEMAEEDFQRAFALQPRCVSVHYFRGLMSKVAGRRQQAKEHFSRCIEIEPRHAEALQELQDLT